MNQNNCFNCGGEIENVNGLPVCRSCGAVMPESVSDKESKLLSAAFDLLHQSQFDDAKTAFEEIICQYPYHPEGYWGRLRARYHISYITVADGKSAPRCPTRSGANIFEDVDYLKAVEHADEETANFMQIQAKAIKALCSESTLSKNLINKFTLEEIDPNDATVIPPRKAPKKDFLISLFLIFSVLFATSGFANALAQLVPVSMTESDTILSMETTNSYDYTLMVPAGFPILEEVLSFTSDVYAIGIIESAPKTTNSDTIFSTTLADYSNFSVHMVGYSSPEEWFVNMSGPDTPIIGGNQSHTDMSVTIGLENPIKHWKFDAPQVPTIVKNSNNEEEDDETDDNI